MMIFKMEFIGNLVVFPMPSLSKFHYGAWDAIIELTVDIA